MSEYYITKTVNGTMWFLTEDYHNANFDFHFWDAEYVGAVWFHDKENAKRFLKDYLRVCPSSGAMLCQKFTQFVEQ
mgnify:CR=1 FL=1